MMTRHRYDLGARRAGPLLTIRGLRVEAEFDGLSREIIHGVNLTLDRGEVLGLIGESGSGKSTIGLAAMGFARDGCRIAGGAIHFDGIELTALPETRLRMLRGSRIAYVAQSAAATFNPAYKLIDQCVEVPVKHRLMSRADAEEATKSLYGNLCLPDPDTIGFRYPHQVSGGQLQRVMTAMAMVCRPDLIVFDEPTTALDVTTQIEVLLAMRDIVRQFNTAAIYISHDLAVVAQMADRIMVLREGTLVEEGSMRAILVKPENEYTRALVALRSFQKSPAAKKAGNVPLLKVERVAAAYQALPVLQDVSFDIWPNQTVAVVGESGSGKSTMARVVAGLLQSKEGQLLWRGSSLAPSFRQRLKIELQKIQMVYQSPDTALNPKQSVRDIVGRPVAFYLDMGRRAREERIRELLSLMELEPSSFIDRLPHQLSGGQKQRICIARALAAEPDLVICDEITSALDSLVAEGILKLLDRLQQELGLSYIFISHDISTVRAIADQVVVMFRGRIVESGRKEEVLETPRHDYTKRLIAAVPEMDPDWLDAYRGSKPPAAQLADRI